MRTFIFRCHTRLGGKLTVEVNAYSRDEAMQKIRARGYEPLNEDVPGFPI